MNRILLFKPGAIGDLLQITPVIRALSVKYPEALISVMVGNAGAASLFKNNPYVYEVLVFDRKGEHASYSAFLKLFMEVWKRRFDLVLNFQRSNIKGWLLLLAAMPARYLVYRKSSGRTIHAVKNHLETLIPLGFKQEEAGLELEFYPGEAALAEASDIFCSHGIDRSKVVALNPGASHAVNRWSTRQFAELSDLLQAESAIRILLVGGVADRGLAEEIISIVEKPVIDLVGATSIETTGAILSKCRLLISGDTGPMHLATAVGTPVIALFGAADPARTGPIGGGSLVLQAPDVACVPCRSRRCNNVVQLECMQRLTVSSVLTAARQLFERECH